MSSRDANFPSLAAAYPRPSRAVRPARAPPKAPSTPPPADPPTDPPKAQEVAEKTEDGDVVRTVFINTGLNLSGACDPCDLCNPAPDEWPQERDDQPPAAPPVMPRSPAGDGPRWAPAHGVTEAQEAALTRDREASMREFFGAATFEQYTFSLPHHELWYYPHDTPAPAGLRQTGNPDEDAMRAVIAQRIQLLMRQHGKRQLGEISMRGEAVKGQGPTGTRAVLTVTFSAI